MRTSLHSELRAHLFTIRSYIKHLTVIDAYTEMIGKGSSNHGATTEIPQSSNILNTVSDIASVCDGLTDSMHGITARIISIKVLSSFGSLQLRNCIRDV